MRVYDVHVSVEGTCAAAGVWRPEGSTEELLSPSIRDKQTQVLLGLISPRF